MASFVYIMALRKNGTLYVGVTTDLKHRVWEHRDKVIGGFTAKYDCTLLVWFREFENVIDAIAEEKRIKKWRRAWKLELIEKGNPYWRDLYPDLALSFRPYLLKGIMDTGLHGIRYDALRAVGLRLALFSPSRGRRVPTRGEGERSSIQQSPPSPFANPALAS